MRNWRYRQTPIALVTKITFSHREFDDVAVLIESSNSYIMHSEVIPTQTYALIQTNIAVLLHQRFKVCQQLFLSPELAL